MSAPRAVAASAPPAQEPGAAPTFVRYQLLAALCLAAVIAYIHRGCLAVPRDDIENDLRLTPAQMDQVLSAFFLGYAIFQIPSGWIADRWGARRTLSVFMLLWSAALGLTAAADSFVAIIALQVFVGMAQACIFPCCVKKIGRAHV